MMNSGVDSQRTQAAGVPASDRTHAQGKNLIILADGTGQAGGLRPDQQLSNVYKLFRACRSGPDSPIDPALQLAFYDAGLGTDPDVGSIPFRIARFLRRVSHLATGAGISQNVIDCYSAILKHYEPGDRLFLFGFSRGAYTVRCVAGVLNLCGIPTRVGTTSGYPRYGAAMRRIAREAVRHVYEHGAGKPRQQFDAQREELARRFRAKYGSDESGHSNIAPHFIGVFDTVAALGAKGLARATLAFGLLLLIAILAAGVAAVAGELAGTQFWPITAGIFAGAVFGAFMADVIPRIKHIRNYPSDPPWRRWHIAGWKLGFYDRFLDPRVRFARHALSIDEKRADFARVPWGFKSAVDSLVPGEPPRLIQLWFAGNHSDVGGSYPEDESRLSDISLQWMVEQATEIPHPLILDRSRLHIYPSAAGMQHCEVASLRDKYPHWARQLLPGWRVKRRSEVLGAPLHQSVLDRFQLDVVQQCATRAPYRPAALRADPRVAHLYSGDGSDQDGCPS